MRKIARFPPRASRLKRNEISNVMRFANFQSRHTSLLFHLQNPTYILWLENESFRRTIKRILSHHMWTVSGSQSWKGQKMLRWMPISLLSVLINLRKFRCYCFHFLKSFCFTSEVLCHFILIRNTLDKIREQTPFREPIIN